MVSYELQNYEYDIIRLVLILIVVEDGLVRNIPSDKQKCQPS